MPQHNVRSLHYFWMSCLKECRKIPGIYEVLRRSESVVWLSLQSISQVMFSPGGGRLLFFWRTFKYDSWDAFCTEHPEYIRVMRRSFLSTSGWIYRRHWVYLLEPPWGLTALSDKEADPYVVDKVCSRWQTSNACCLKPGFARDWKLRGITIVEFRTRKLHGCTLQGSSLQFAIK